MQTKSTVVNVPKLDATELRRLGAKIKPMMLEILKTADNKFDKRDFKGLTQLRARGEISKNYFADKSIRLLAEGKLGDLKKTMESGGINSAYVAEYGLNFGFAKIATEKYDTARFIHNAAMGLVVTYGLNGSIEKAAIAQQNLLYV